MWLAVDVLDIVCDTVGWYCMVGLGSGTLSKRPGSTPVDLSVAHRCSDPAELIGLARLRSATAKSAPVVWLEVTTYEYLTNLEKSFDQRNTYHC